MYDDLHMHLVLISFPAKFNQFKVRYNCQKEKLTLNGLISYCVQEEKRLKQSRIESNYLASTSKDKLNTTAWRFMYTWNPRKGKLTFVESRKERIRKLHSAQLKRNGKSQKWINRLTITFVEFRDTWRGIVSNTAHSM